jgi:hypothetical protein
MREHPIPQDIVGYKFHIIGNMTLKQFAELAAGALLGLVIYSTNLPIPIKWPLICIVIGMGAAAAFLPIEERPLDHWITTFIRIMYRPTKFYWQRVQKIPDAFNFTPNSNTQTQESMVDLSPARRDRIKEYIASVNYESQDVDSFTLLEQQRLQEIMLAFQSVQPQQVNITQMAQKPDLTIKVRSLQQPHGVSGADDAVIVFDQKQREPLLTKHQKSVEEVAINMAVPDTAAPEIERQKRDFEAQAVSSQQESAYISSDDTVTAAQPDVANESAMFNSALPFPTKPTQPNKLVGMVLTRANELIPDAIVEVRDEQNKVVRAVKSNALGQFFITTPLRSGAYSLVVEHDNYQFPTIEMSLNDEIVDPVEIRSLG